ncbi:hypothetical protein WH367_07245 [Comamonas sp. MYb21]|uniref:hypothetical protein n=1 Tax=Comamonas sp. MYb21 TaxID=1848648 RepID=UPI0030A98897
MDASNNFDDEVANEQRLRSQLERKIIKWKCFLAVFALILVCAYFGYFGGHLKQDATTDASKWGSFGDFVGGLMNPVVAFAAFFWLTESVKIQKQELADTRRELANATSAQHLLVKNGRQSVELAALTTLLNVNNNDIARFEQRIDDINVKLAEIESLREDLTADCSSLTAREEMLKTQRTELYKKMSVLVMNGEEHAKKVERILNL